MDLEFLNLDFHQKIIRVKIAYVNLLWIQMDLSYYLIQLKVKCLITRLLFLIEFP